MPDGVRGQVPALAAIRGKCFGGPPTRTHTLSTRRSSLAVKIAAPEPTVLEQLRKPFPASDVKQRPGGGGQKLDYVAIETVLARLLDIAPDYSWDGRLVHFADNTAVVEGTLAIGSKIAYGIGAMKNPDTDMAVKSANSEAMKNAAKNGFGIALELWSAEHRQNLDVARRAAGGDEQALKKAVFDIAKRRLAELRPTAAQVAKLFNVKPGDLSDADALRGILETEGVL